jgi:CRP/FNR family transcriptional regulator, cyclic AMP receptor protein
MATSTPLSPRAALLSRIPMLAVFGPGQLEKMAQAGVERTFHPGETILRQGERGLGLYVMLNGTAELRRSGQGTGSISGGQFFGAGALVGGDARTTEVFAISEVRCFVLNRWDFWKAVGIDPQSDLPLYEATLERLRSLQPIGAE